MATNQSPYEMSEMLKEFYDYVSRTQDIEKRLASFRNFRSYHFKDLYYIKKNIAGTDVRNVLDIGCCGTPYPELFDLDKVNYTGIDISQLSLDRMKVFYAGKRIKWVMDDICRLNEIENESIDLILATQVFEHVIKPEQALFACIKKLCPGGRLMIGTESAFFIQNGPRYGFFGKTVLGLSMYAGAAFCLYGLEPLFYLHTEKFSFKDSKGVTRNVLAPHGYYHPLFFRHIIKEYDLPAEIVFSRVTGGTVLDEILSRFGEKVYYGWQEVKAAMPLLCYLGWQIFVVIRKKDESVYETV